MRRPREVEIPLEQPNQEGHYTPNPDVMAAIKQLPPYLQSVVTLMANMVAPSEEERLWEKKGFNAFAQSTGMILAVSLILFRIFF